MMQHFGGPLELGTNLGSPLTRCKIARLQPRWLCGGCFVSVPFVRMGCVGGWSEINFGVFHIFMWRVRTDIAADLRNRCWLNKHCGGAS
jgi:hypothetical protein